MEQIDPSAAIEALIADVLSGKAVSLVSARFHNGLAHLVRDVCASIRVETSVSRVALSGGVWQNVTLLMKTIPLLQQDGFQVYFHRKVPANDSGLALGQAVIAAKPWGQPSPDDWLPICVTSHSSSAWTKWWCSLLPEKYKIQKQSLPQVAETNTPRSMDVTGGCSL